MAADKWNGHAHDDAWFTVGNWSKGVPVAQQVTSFSDGGTWAISLAGTMVAEAGEMMVRGDALTFSRGTLQLDAAPVKQGNPTDLLIANGSVTVARGARVFAQNTVQVGGPDAGSFGPGTLTVQGRLTASVIAVDAGSMVVDGQSAHVSDPVGELATVGATLTISGGATFDGGAHTLSQNLALLQVGSGAYGDGVVTVTGAGSTLVQAGVYLGNGYDGTLSVLAGGFAHVNYLDAGSFGDGFLNVSGEGSSLVAARSIRIGNPNVLPAASTISITDGGSVSVGRYGLFLGYGKLVLDATAHLTGRITSEVGKIDAVAVSGSNGGTVTLTQTLTLESNDGGQGQFDHNTTVYSEGGAVLNLAGLINGQSDAVLSVGSGSVVLSDGRNTYHATSLYNAHLEIAASGAAGHGTLTFTAGAAQAPTLQIDAGVDFTNKIAGFTGGDMIDLRGFAFQSGITDDYAGGKLKLSNGTSTSTLSITGTYAASNFAFADDHHGGVLITYVHG